MAGAASQAELLDPRNAGPRGPDRARRRRRRGAHPDAPDPDRRRRGRSQRSRRALFVRDRLLGLTIAAVASLVILPITWYHYPVVLMPFGIAAVARAGPLFVRPPNGPARGRRGGQSRRCRSPGCPGCGSRSASCSLAWPRAPQPQLPRSRNETSLTAVVPVTACSCTVVAALTHRSELVAPSWGTADMHDFLAYIDPGSGSLIIQALIAGLVADPVLLPAADRPVRARGQARRQPGQHEQPGQHDRPAARPRVLTRATTRHR